MKNAKTFACFATPIAFVFFPTLVSPKTTAQAGTGALLSLGVVERVGEADAFDRVLRDAVEDLRRSNSGNLIEQHEEVLETMQRCLDRTPRAARLRRQTAEHPFGTLKAWMGSTHFLTKTLPKVRTEMSLHVLAYNLRRALNIFGTQRLIAFMTA